MSEQDLYLAFPLLGPRDIRILEIEPAKRFDAPMRASMRIITLHDVREVVREPEEGTEAHWQWDQAEEQRIGDNAAARRALGYQTLSYAWGRSPKDVTMSIAGFVVPVTMHLLMGLRRLRQGMWSRRRTDSMSAIWIDAICINQSDDRERAAQVDFMGNIYGQSRRLIVWLGET